MFPKQLSGTPIKYNLRNNMKTNYSTADILFSFPSYDDDDETWHLRHIWVYMGSKRCTYTECDTDGNHEPISAREVRKLEKELASLWLKYSRWALEHGEDPAGEFMVKYTKQFKRNIIVHFSHWIGEAEHGLACRLVRWSGGLQEPQELPVGLQEFLSLKKVGDRWCMEGVTVDVLRDNVGCLGRDYFKAKAEWKEPISEDKIRAEVRRIARKHIAREVAKVAA